jgi:hypothetical protein
MKKLLAILLFALLSSPAAAGVSCSVPFTLTNGTTADATQVMANYNAILTCLGQAAHAGANSDITSLTGLTTPISPVQGGTTVFSGANSTGTANVQVVASTTPSTFTLTKNYVVFFQIGGGLTNTGAVTLAVNGTSATALVKPTSAGTTALVGGELIAGQVATVVYDGTQYQLMSPSFIWSAIASLASLTLADQVVSGGANVTTLTLTTGSVIIDCGARPLQSISNNGAFTITAPTSDGSCDLLVTNTASAATITFTGFTTSANTGDAFTTTALNKFIVHIERIAGTSTWFNKALQ